MLQKSISISKQALLCSFCSYVRVDLQTSVVSHPKSLLSSVTSIDVVVRELCSAIEFEKTVNDDVCWWICNDRCIHQGSGW